MAAPHESIVLDYARDTVDSPDACLDTQAAARRYLADLRNPMWNFRTGMAETIIEIIESLFCHQQGEDLLGRPLRGKPLILEPFQLFVIYNVCGFFYPGTDLRRFQEVLAMLARKNGKTPFATSFCWAVGLWYARSFSKIKTVSGSMKQNMEGFGFLRYNLRRLGLTMDIDPAHGLRMLDSSLGHSFEGPIWDGQISFEALAYKPDVFDAFNANVVLLDELELYKNAIPYGRLKDASKAYGNKLIMAVTTAGDDGTGFCAQRVSYCSKIARGEITGADADRIFAFIARADPDPDTDEVNYLDPANWRKANPNWGVTIRPSDMEASALQAQNDPQMRKEFLTRSLNVFVSSFRAWFTLDEFIHSDSHYDFSQSQLARLAPYASVPLFWAYEGKIEAYPYQPCTRDPDVIPCATGTRPCFVTRTVDVGEGLECGPNLLEDIIAAEDAPVGAVKIVVTEQDDVDIFAQHQYAIGKALCLWSDVPELLEQALRVYQGRAFYDGTGDLDRKELDRLSWTYGLIVL